MTYRSKRYACDCGEKTNDADVALYHSLELNHRVEIDCPEIPERTEYTCGCWYSREEAHCCDQHTRKPR